MKKEINVHLGCGTVYLEGWLNIDYHGISPVTHKKDLEANLTDIAHYYKYPYKPASFGEKPHERNVVLDVNADAKKLPFADKSVDRLLSVNMINHIRFQEFLPMMQDWLRILKPGGELIIDIDDVKGMCEDVIKAATTADLEKALRYLYCHSRTIFDSHFWGYTPEYLTELLEKVGFKYAWRNDEFIHHDADYPRFLLGFTKPYANSTNYNDSSSIFSLHGKVSSNVE